MKRPLKIAIIADALDYQYAGIYYYTKEILQALARVDQVNEYLFVRSKSEGHISDNVKELIIPTGNFPGAAPYRLFFTIPKRLKQEKVDIVIEPRHFGPFNLPPTIKRITFIHDLSPLHHPEWHQLVSRKLQQLFLPSILQRADHILTNSVYTQKDIIKHFPSTASKITATLLGKEEYFQARPNPAFIASLQITGPYLLHVGTIEPRKNLTTLVTAFEAYKQTANDNLQLVLVGKKGWKNTDFFERLENSPFKSSIHQIGYVKRADLVALYSSAHAFVFPSLFEGFGLPILEAMSCGCPVISSNAASLPEIGGTACLYFPPLSSTKLVEQINQLNNPTQREKLVNASLQQASKFSWDQTARETLAVFEGLG